MSIWVVVYNIMAKDNVRGVLHVLKFRFSTGIGVKGRLVNMSLPVRVGGLIILCKSDNGIGRGYHSKVDSGEGIRCLLTYIKIKVLFGCGYSNSRGCRGRLGV